ncbi:MAG TPA: dTMP kinase [Acidimicrobiales bacterium]|nr:dTMP kinase [Acidimicrobiales bacterium]
MSRLIVLEGGEATGKSTQAALLADRLGAVLTHEPGGTAVGRRIRALILDPAVDDLDLRAETLLFLADRAQHVARVIAPALAAGRDVVCDRFAGSTLAYQGYGRGLDPARLADLSAWAAGGVVPDQVLLLRVPRPVAEARRAARGQADRMEQAGDGFFDRVDAGFAALAGADPSWRVVDGVGTVDEVAARIDAALA